MNIAQLSEQLKDVPQSTLIGYAKNPNSVVPQFLALAEIQRRQQLQAPAQAPQSTVANDVLSQAQPAPQMMQAAPQLPENQPGVAQLPTGMSQGFASGGIVAFANGGVPDQEDEDYEDYLDRVETSKRRGMIDEALASLKGRVAGIVSALPKSYEDTKREASSVSGDDLKALLSKVSMLESGGKDYDKYGRLLTSSKGAEGRMQTMRGTQRAPGFGITPVRDSSVEEKNRVGEEYFAAMLDKFKDPKIAAMAYNWGPGNVQKWLDSGKKIAVPEETRKYASHFAKGGIADIPRFYEGQKISLSDYYSAQDAEDKAAFSPAILTPNTVSTEPSRYDKFFADIAEEREGLKKQAKQDLALSIMQAGLGMMGSRSPYFLQGIGEGAQQGISTFAALGKQRGAEAAALRKAEAAALDSQILGEIRKQGIDERALAAKEATEARISNAAERARLMSVKEANDVREAALARFNADPMTKQLAKKLEETTPGTPEFEWYTNEFNRLRNNALAQAKVPGANVMPQASPFPTGKVDVPGSISQWWHNYSPEDIKALEWANANPLDPRANAIKERFKK